MPLNATGDIEYLDMSISQERILFQADPPVCNICKQAITRDNFGWAHLEGSPGGSDKQVMLCPSFVVYTTLILNVLQSSPRQPALLV